MKKLFTILLIAVSFSVNAQTTTTEPYIGQKGKIEIDAGYGIITAQDIITGVSTVVSSALLAHAVERVDGKGFGALFVNLDYYVGDKTAVGIQLNYAHYQTNYKMSSGNIESLKTKYFSPMLHTKYNWVNKPILNIYSAAAVGATFYTSKNEAGEKKNITSFAFQASPIGLRVGNKVAFFAELGFGFQGLISGGLSLRF